MINEAEEDAVTIAEDKVLYKLELEVELTEAGAEESSEDLVALEPALPTPIPAPIPASIPTSVHVLETGRVAAPKQRGRSL
jgi:hypothetical protein